MITILPSLKTVVMILMMNVKVVDNKDDADTNLHGKVHLDGKLNPDDNTNVDADNQIFDPDNTDPEDSYGDPDLINNNQGPGHDHTDDRGHIGSSGLEQAATVVTNTILYCNCVYTIFTC